MKSPVSTVSHGDWRDRHQNLLEKDCARQAAIVAEGRD